MNTDDIDIPVNDATPPTQLPADAGWVHAVNETVNYPEHTERGGKWLVFLSASTVDRYWAQIRLAVLAGRLGDEAKCSTSSARRPDSYVVCVYTYDYQDKEDVMRIRKVLYGLGLRRPIPYKSDEQTRKLLYGNNYEPIYRV